MSDWKHITMFDREYSKKQQAEGIAVNEAVVYGHCNRCDFLSRCSTDDNFRPPIFAWCFRRKHEILAEWEKQGNE